MDTRDEDLRFAFVGVDGAAKLLLFSFETS